jgi:hypothetical protein
MTKADEVTRKVPDYPETRLAFRVWRLDSTRNVLLSVNLGQAARNASWVAKAMSFPEGEWSTGEPMFARCLKGRDHESGVPDPECTCGLYATTDLELVNRYLDHEAPVLGIVELGGRTIPATKGYRAEAAKVVALLLIDEMFTLRHTVLAKVANHYRVPSLVPHSAVADEYRSELQQSSFGPADWEQLNRLLDQN